MFDYCVSRLRADPNGLDLTLEWKIFRFGYTSFKENVTLLAIIIVSGAVVSNMSGNNIMENLAYVLFLDILNNCNEALRWSLHYRIYNQINHFRISHISGLSLTSEHRIIEQ